MHSGKLILLHTNDIHSHFEEAARAADYINEVRRSVPEDRLLLVDCGDHLDRVRIETEGTGGAVNRQLLTRLGYEAATLGNNEGLTYSPDELDRLYAGSRFSVVCANLKLAAGGRPPEWMKRSLIVRKAGLTVGIFGLTVQFSEFYEQLGWEVSDPFEEAASCVAELRAGCDVVVALSHLGLRQDERLASAVPGIDLILGAHTHHLLEVPLVVSGTTVCAAGKFARHVGVVEIERRADGRGLVISGRAVPTEGRPADPETAGIVAAALQEAKLAMASPVAELSMPLGGDADAESPLGTLLAGALRRATGAEIGLTNAGQLLDGLAAGPVTRERIHAVCPSPINPCLIELSGARLVEAFEESLLPEFIGLQFQGFGFRGKVLGRLCTDGAEVVYDPAAAPRARIRAVLVNGEPLDESRIYKVGTLDMFTFGIGYVGLKQGRVARYFLPEFIRDLLAESLGDEAAVADCLRPRWTASAAAKAL
ncbi:bifunctional metallophosphatase/5'-nucleotidase [Cohnella sp. JJ-181]|uniref:bifunctional metallophosphatase/5'-nucleotidase n=1 Tax=Cohnella rhizoplanae TaxID=2974897 RepID=UPI0022FF8012|nr:bifunctional UDP-sugar hydrolase/5'-nucleotidase [Cohnella sp. JJ-181]CAI6082177.1 Mannosylglucosyl-3-phosphoglycerate phosphatase [Cohnella sp. JJ-181]